MGFGKGNGKHKSDNEITKQVAVLTSYIDSHLKEMTKDQAVRYNSCEYLTKPDGQHMNVMLTKDQDVRFKTKVSKVLDADLDPTDEHLAKPDGQNIGKAETHDEKMTEYPTKPDGQYIAKAETYGEMMAKDQVLRYMPIGQFIEKAETYAEMMTNDQGVWHKAKESKGLDKSSAGFSRPGGPDVLDPAVGRIVDFFAMSKDLAHKVVEVLVDYSSDNDSHNKVARHLDQVLAIRKKVWNQLAAMFYKEAVKQVDSCKSEGLLRWERWANDMLIVPGSAAHKYSKAVHDKPAVDSSGVVWCTVCGSYAG